MRRLAFVHHGRRLLASIASGGQQHVPGRMRVATVLLSVGLSPAAGATQSYRRVQCAQASPCGWGRSLLRSAQAAAMSGQRAASRCATRQCGHVTAQSAVVQPAEFDWRLFH